LRALQISSDLPPKAEAHVLNRLFPSHKSITTSATLNLQIAAGVFIMTVPGLLNGTPGTDFPPKSSTCATLFSTAPSVST
jgi:hypothetical protein